jgi:hypothetical protein
MAYKATRRTAVKPLFVSAIPNPLNLYVSLAIFNHWPPVPSLNTPEEATPGTQR